MVNNSLNFMFSLINSASITNRGDISIPTSKKCSQVLSILYKQGLIRGFYENNRKTKIYLKYSGSTIKPVIRYIQAISVNGRPFYTNTKSLSKLVHSNEIFLISTPKGVLTLNECIQHKVGGFVFCKII